MTHPLSETLRSRTFFGLLLAQFTATFNDQAIHMVAVFYAVDVLWRFAKVPHLDDKAVVSIVTACFITPFVLFSSYAGPLGDRFSKRSVIVFWKVAEVGIMALALLGLLLPHLVPADSLHLRTVAVWSATLVIATVFLMGLHSTFFVPAKLGAMPEILHPSILSRGNGILEGTSFTAQILGTSFGGIMYALLKGEVAVGQWQGDTFNGQWHLGKEWVIGVVLLGLALLGTASAFLMERIPAAAPNLTLSWSWWRPLKQNLAILWRSKPLTLSVTGIAFCVFMTLFLRQTLLYQGELKKEFETARAELAVAEGRPADRSPTGVDKLMSHILPARLEKARQEPELRVALLFALVGLGVGLGSLAAGYLSGHRVELGLVPIGAVSIILFAILPALVRRSPQTFVACLFGIGFGAGFYLVPLYTLLQHRAPKESKGNVVAASNFLNVVGGVIAVAAFYLLSYVLDRMLGTRLSELDVKHDPGLLQRYVIELEGQLVIPRLLFLSTALMTALAMVVLLRKLPDFFLRAGIWLSAWGHNPLRTVAIDHMPLDGPVILLTNSDTIEKSFDLIAAVDRYAHLVLVEPGTATPERALLERIAERSSLVRLRRDADSTDWQRARQVGHDVLRAREMIALTISDPARDGEADRTLREWKATAPAVVLPVCCTRRGNDGPPRVVFGTPLSGDVGLPAAREAIDHLATLSDHDAEEGN